MEYEEKYLEKYLNKYLNTSWRMYLNTVYKYSI